MTLPDFSYLKEQVVQTVVSNDRYRDILHSLKELFRRDINSVRRFEKIQHLWDLLNVLELRGLLSEDNIDPLKDIARKINSNDLLVKIEKYEENHVPREFGNSYESGNANKTLPSESPINTVPFSLNISNAKKERIIQTVVEEIGSYWRDLGRSLHIRECVIDEIDHNSQNLATKAFKMMEKYEARADPQKWFFVLCEALHKIHRKDITTSVQSIMLMNF